ncbi:PKD domain-containing protein [Fontivita pretiosa]|uniref:PKD domain-containing protein n=1 Tax=Fontivita pretiosa TaxID=2989684 RepID=UPI003D164349
MPQRFKSHNASKLNHAAAAESRPTRRGLRRQRCIRHAAHQAIPMEQLEQRICMAVSYAAAVNYTVAGRPDFIATADFNADGRKDLVTSSYANSSLSILLGNTNGTFAAATTITLASPADFVAAGDVNADGKADLITVSYENNNVGVMLGNGNGTFGVAAFFAAGNGPRAVVLGDFNGDAKVDLAVAKAFDTNLSILRGNGNGTFMAPANSAVGFTPSDLVAGDFNADGKLDLAAADYFGDKVYVLLGNGNATFAAGVSYATSAGPASIAAGDLNNDGVLDIVTAGYLANKLSVLRGNAGGTFQAAVHYNAGSGTTFVAVADLDGDGNRDVVAANETSNNVSVLFGNGTATLAAAVNYTVGANPRSLVLANFNGDSAIDIAVANQGASTVSVLLANGITPPAPTADAGGPYTVAEGGSVQLNGSGSTGSGLSYAWDLDGDGIFGETGAAATRGVETGATPTFNAAGLDGPSSRTVSLRVTDSASRTSTATATINITNVAPTLSISGANSVAEGATYTLNLSASDPGSDTITRWVINWGDGTAAQTVNGNPSSITHVFADNGSYTITATATDEDGTFNANSKAVTVTNVAPTLTIGGANSVAAGAAYTLTLSASDPGSDTIARWVITWGDGTAAQTVNGNPSSVTHVFANAGSYTITATATDEDGTYNANSKAITVTAPTAANAGGPYTVAEGGSVQLNGSGSTGSGLSFAWDLDGDGIFGESGTAATRGVETGATPTFNAAGLDGPSSRTVSLRVTDSTGASSTATATISITNVAPTLSISGANSVAEGATYTLNLSASDPGTDTITQWVIVWGDGAVQTVTGNPSSVTHVFADSGTYSITAAATDEDGTYTSNAKALTVTNVAPTLSISGANSVAEGATYTLNLSASDVGNDTISRWVINWGDGTAAQTINGNPSSITHVFADNGSYTITATATDEDGTYNANTKAVTVTNVAPTLTISGPNSVQSGSVYTLSLSSSDPGSDTITSWTIDWGDGTGPQVVAGNPSSVTHTYSGGSATYTISASATDEDGTYNANSKSVSVVGPTVTADAGGPYTVAEGGSVQLDGSSSSGSGLSYAWDLDGDGIFGETGAAATRGVETGATPTFNATGLDGPSSRTVSLRVTDSGGNTSTATATINITNVAPTLSISGANSVAEGATYTLNLSASDPGTDTISGWVIDWGDGSDPQTVTGNPSGVTHVFGDDGTYTITATATDEDGTHSANAKTVTVTNVAPTLTTGGAGSVAEGSAYTLNLAVSDAGNDLVTSWLIDWGDGSTQTISGNPSSVTHVYGDDGAYTISATASDEDGTYNASAHAVTVTNVAPTLTISGPNSVQSGSVYTLSLSSSDPGSDTITSWTIDWGDGTGPQLINGNPTNVTHTYSGAANYTITATATDEDGTYAANSKSVAVVETNLVANAGGPYTVGEGGSVQLDGSGSSGSGLSYAWDLDGDGIFGESGTAATRGDETGATPTFNAAGLDGPATRTVSLRVTDSGGNTATDTATISITNVAPTLTISGADTVAEGSVYVLSLGRTDPGSDTIARWVINWGDGTVQTINGSPASVTHTFADDGTFTITATATDEDGTYSANTKGLSVTNVAPTLTISGNDTLAEGSNYTLRLTRSDPGADTIARWVIDWGDGTIQTINGSPGSVKHLYADDGTYTISATASDEDGTYSANSKTLTVNNVAPTLTISGPNTTAEGSTYTLTLTRSDPGADTIRQWIINWGDGSTQTISGSPASVTHVFADNGSYSITASAADEDGTYNANSRSVTVTNVAPAVAITGPASVAEGGTYTLLLSASDPGDDTIIRWVINWGDGSPAQTINGNPSSVTHVFADNMAVTITATATDEDGTWSAGSKSVSVTNVAPTLSISGSGSAQEGSSYTLNLAETDPGNDTITRWVINWGDGFTSTLSGNPSSAAHTYADNGTFTITATATDEDGTFGSNASVVMVANVAPTLTLSGNGSGAEGSAYQLGLGKSDPGNDTITSWIINWGDGMTQIVPGSPAAVSHVYADNGQYTITATATDEDGTYAANSRSVSISNVAPTLTISGPDSVQGGKPYTLTLAHTDPGNDTISQWVINWGDGSTQTISGSPSSVTHVYAIGGTSYTISATASDEDGTYAANSKTVVVAVGDGAAPTAAVIMAPGVYSAGGTSYQFRLVYNDDTGVDTSSFDGSDVVVTGPGGFSQRASFVEWYNASGNQKVVIYSITPPGGSWDPFDDGFYKINVRANQVRDLAGRYVAAGEVGQFAVGVLPPELAGNTLAEARDLGTVVPGKARVYDDGVGVLDRNDFYKFTVSSNVSIDLRMYYLRDNAELFLLDSSGTRLAESRNSGATMEQITKTLKPGTYFIRVVYTGTAGTPYRLRIAASATVSSTPPLSVNLSAATDLGVLSPGAIKVVDDSIASTSEQDLYRFSLSSATQLYAKLYNNTQDVQLELLDSTGRRLYYSGRTGATAAEAFYANLSAGTYYVRVIFAGAAKTNYRLRLAA